MVKAALKNKAIDKHESLTNAEETQQILTTLIKQRTEAVESFTKGGRPDLAEKAQLEIGMIEGYLPQTLGWVDMRKLVRGVIAHLQKDAGGVRGRGRRIWAPRCRWLSSGFGLLACGTMVSS